MPNLFSINIFLTSEQLLNIFPIDIISDISKFLKSISIILFRSLNMFWQIINFLSHFNFIILSSFSKILTLFSSSIIDGFPLTKISFGLS